ncbi:prolyl endopeptidase [Galendromus occidentalis]|uniref:Prolyl endopeptidase n=1 Tax=Galendromus occidentalis TaxID=34638 RepID=A0AAJ6QM29_9ACAR|nr:prolyl endopeptidase [Galendromus occidentalis]
MIRCLVQTAKNSRYLRRTKQVYSRESASWIASMPVTKYPTPRRSDTSEVLHGITVKDPYRWMEDPDAEETKAFVEAQNKISKPYLDRCPHKKELTESLTKLWNYPKFTVPSRKGDYYYFRHNSGLQNQFVTYMKKNLDDEPEVFLDPNSLSEDGTVSLTESAFSENGNYYCYGLAQSGSDWSTLHVKDVRQKKDLPEKLERFRYSSVSWTIDEKGFFYGQYPDWSGKVTGTEAKAVENQKLFYHRLSTPQSEDVMCVEFPKNPEWRITPEVSYCGRHLIVSVQEGCQDNIVFVADIPENVTGVLELKPIYETFDCRLEYITNDDDIFYFRTNKDRPTYGVVKINIRKPQEWIDVVPAHPKNVLEWALAVDGDKLIVEYCQDVVSKLQIHKLSGEFLQNLPLDIGAVSEISGKRKLSEIFLKFSSFLTPGRIYRCEIDKAPEAVLEEHKNIELAGLPTDDLEVEQVFYASQDGTKVPMFITRKKDLPRDGSAPCLLYIYGGFSINLSPSFSLFRLMLIKRLGFSVAVANVRGGGEYGEEWHNGGCLKNKQNTLDDVHAAAAFLADNGYTRASQLVLMGGSNGGMVTAASINQRPELFGAAIAQVPVTDMFRFHKFTVGHAWCSDFGNPDKAEDFEVQRKYSPLHNIPADIDNYPSLLVTTADHDDRVVPSHSLKFIAELQHRLGEKNQKPLLALIDTKAGHGAGKPTSKVIDELVEYMCFLNLTLDAKYRE